MLGFETIEFAEGGGDLFGAKDGGEDHVAVFEDVVD